MGKFDKLQGVFDKQKMWVAFVINLRMMYKYSVKKKKLIPNNKRGWQNAGPCNRLQFFLSYLHRLSYQQS